jgi:parallel beta-helix repeat protein
MDRSNTPRIIDEITSRRLRNPEGRSLIYWAENNGAKPSSRFRALPGVLRLIRSKNAVTRVIFFCLLICTMAAPASGQRTINVPGNVASIQAGINAASNGDTVLVAPGTYTENINFNGKNITVTSSGGAAATIINGNSNGVVVTFSSGEGRQSVISGFTIEGGALPTNASDTATSDGIFVDNSNPTITNNIITLNRGYGIEIQFGSAYVSGNTITSTSTRYDPRYDFGCDYDDGDGIYIGGTSNTITAPPVIDHNTIEQNVGHCDGGGIGLYAAPPATVISNNVIANNQSLGYGGGIYVVNGSVSLYQNLIYNNVSGVAGGGVYLTGISEVNGATGPLTVFITNNTIYGNTIQLNPNIVDAWVDGSQVALPGYVSQIGFFNNLIIANDSYSAIACWSVYQYLSGAPPVVMNSDVMNTAGAAYGGWCTTPAGATGNISVDPKFNNPSSGDFHLQAGSPAIDAGFNAAPGMLPTDLDGNPRIQNATGASQPMVDMGVYEAAGPPESRLPSQTTLTAQPGTVFYGQPVNLSATVTDSPSSSIPTGTVNFMDDWSVIQQSALNSSGVATWSTSSLAVGSHWLVASFGGNNAYQPGVSTTAEVVIQGFSTSTSISFSANPVRSGQPETLSATVTLGSGNPAGTGTPTGSIAFYTSTSLTPNLLPTVPLNANGVATYTSSSLPSGTTYVQALYQPTGGFLASSSQNLPLQIVAPPVATVTVSLSPSLGSVPTGQPLIATITASGNSGNPTPTGSVTLTSGSYLSAATSLNNGSATITVPAGSLAVGNDTLTIQYSGDSVYGTASGTSSITVTGPFAISGTPLIISLGATSGNQSMITVTPSGGFTGNVALTAAVASSPPDATNLPTLSFGTTGNVSITTASAGTAMLTISTASPQGCSQSAKRGRSIPWWPEGGLTFACILLLVTPRRGAWRRRLAILLLLAGLMSSATACNGGSGAGSKGTCTVLTSGTTPGTYIITVTGTSGTTTAIANVALTVQ